jgi:hypothetical protein
LNNDEIEPSHEGYREDAFEIDLRQEEGTSLASLRVYDTRFTQDWMGGGPGVTIEADRGAHGAELHLSWEQTSALRNELSRLLREAGTE